MSSPVNSPGVAAFDFDGTLTQRDSLVPFLSFATSRTRVAAAAVRHAPSLLGMATGRGDRDRAKELLVGRLLRGRPHAGLVELGVEYATTLRGHRLRSSMVDRLEWHRAQGHRIVIVSASLDLYLLPMAEHLGVDHVIATRLATGADGRCTGQLLGANVRGPEKVVRLREWLGAEAVELWAYGDSDGDRELLQMADHAVRVGRASP